MAFSFSSPKSPVVHNEDNGLKGPVVQCLGRMLLQLRKAEVIGGRPFHRPAPPVLRVAGPLGFVRATIEERGHFQTFFSHIIFLLPLQNRGYSFGSIVCT
ncbi:hypothetical protein CDAR_122561 [Caerostris darwini]|uniref:Uncharacterized protein n=1 Tax=Caerostris darwini TaxID=1538125 RepID=A0AAV4MBR2_9ARAC|nr:hypothetical protein CDAR_122561 [Caerostris darwini]